MFIDNSPTKPDPPQDEVGLLEFMGESVFLDKY